MPRSRTDIYRLQSLLAAASVATLTVAAAGQAQRAEPRERGAISDRDAQRLRTELEAASGAAALRRPAAEGDPASDDPEGAPGSRLTPLTVTEPAAGVERGAIEEGDGSTTGATVPPPNLEGTVRFTDFTEAVELAEIVNYVAGALNINIIAPESGVPGSVVFNAPVEVQKARLLPLLDALLEQQNFGITFDDDIGFYIIRPAAELPNIFDRPELRDTAGVGGRIKVIKIPILKPSALSGAIDQILGGPGGGAAGSVTYLDDVGLMIVTNTARNIERVEALVKEIEEQVLNLPLHEIPLRYVSAPIARQNILELSGGGSSTGVAGRAVRPGQNQANNQAQAGSIGSSLEGITQRLAVAPQGNALLFRGTEQELAQLSETIRIIDQPNPLSVRRFFAGRFAADIAQFASQRGLGEVVELAEVTGVGRNVNANRVNNQNNNNFNIDSTQIGGPTMVVDIESGNIIYYGTEAQQDSLLEIIEEFPTDEDVLVIRTYRLDNTLAEDVATIIDAILTGQTPTSGDAGGLLPARQGTQGGTRVIGNGGIETVIAQGPIPEGEIGAVFDPDESFVVADQTNNQIIVKAPRAQQEDFAELISRLDLRTRQVFIQATILSVSNTEDFRLAVETQLEIGDAIFQTNYGLSQGRDSITTNLDPQTGLSGLTSAVLLNQYTPVVINAIQDDTDAEVLSRPGLLVNDNQEAAISSLQEQPVSTVSQGETTTTTGFGGFEEAGTVLSVTPTISDAGFLQMEYEVELSNFVGAGTDTLPPARATNVVSGTVTIPSDATIVIGGITVENIQNTISKIPLLGDIPLLGLLFSDTNTSKTDQVLYVFITPKIMTDPNFQDLKLMTEGPLATVEDDPGRPELEPIFMNFASRRDERRRRSIPRETDVDPWNPLVPDRDGTLRDDLNPRDLTQPDMTENFRFDEPNVQLNNVTYYHAPTGRWLTEDEYPGRIR